MKGGFMARAGSTRRRFLGQSGLAAGVLVVPPRVLGLGDRPPSEKLNLAFIGVANRGGVNRAGEKGENAVALCDVNKANLAKVGREYPEAKPYQDFRKMFDEMAGSIDAVVVSTPDHTHAVAAMAALKRGKPVYCEKPLAHNVHEIRQLVKVARETGLPTQMGNQGHSADSIRRCCEWVRDGAIGKVHTVRIQNRSVYSMIDKLGKLKEHPVPERLDWDLWLGPALFRPYSPLYEPGQWRHWAPFGSGCIGDWICHVVDPAFWALDLGSPVSIHAHAEGFDPKAHGDTFPKGARVTFKFAATDRRGPVTLVWCDGWEKVEKPPELENDPDFPNIGGVILGDKGGIVYESHGARNLRLFPESLDKEYKRPPRTIPRVRGMEEEKPKGHYDDWVRAHHEDWTRAIREKGHVPCSNFEYGGALSELALLANIAYRFPDQELRWDGPAMKFIHCPEANAFVNPPYREGWSL
jgi:predicted dehydrogenase